MEPGPPVSGSVNHKHSITPEYIKVHTTTEPARDPVKDITERTSRVVSNHMHKIIIMDSNISKMTILENRNNSHTKFFQKSSELHKGKSRDPQTGIDPSRARLWRTYSSYAIQTPTKISKQSEPLCERYDVHSYGIL